MKHIVFFIFLFSVTPASSQDSTGIHAKWPGMRSQLIAWSLAAKNLAVIAMDSRTVQPAHAEKVRSFSTAIQQLVQRGGQPETTLIERVSSIHDSLKVQLSSLVSALDNDSSLRLLHSYRHFKDRLRLESRKLEVQVFEFNDACRKAGKQAWVFGRENVPDVSFD